MHDQFPDADKSSADWLARYQSRTPGTIDAANFAGEVMAPRLAEMGEEGLVILETLGRSENVSDRSVAAVFFDHLADAAPKKRVLELVRTLLADQSGDIRLTTLETLLDGRVRGDISWLDIREALRPSLFGGDQPDQGANPNDPASLTSRP